MPGPSSTFRNRLVACQGAPRITDLNYGFTRQRIPKIWNIPIGDENPRAER